MPPGGFSGDLLSIGRFYLGGFFYRTIHILFSALIVVGTGLWAGVDFFCRAVGSMG